MNIHYELHVTKPDGRSYKLSDNTPSWFGTHEQHLAEEAAQKWAKINPMNVYRVLEIKTDIREIAKFGGQTNE